MIRAYATLLLLTLAAPAWAQFGILDKGLKRAKQLDDVTITSEEERQLGEMVSARLRQRFGVVQDEAVHKYVTLVGSIVAAESKRPELEWSFIVLDTDGVNAFASPGGFVHITRGALGLIANEAELAGVLGHEITHIAEQHTINAIKKGKLVEVGTSESLASRAPLLDRLANKAYEMVLENSFDRGDEMEADENGISLAHRAGYAPGALSEFLARLAERNEGMAQKNGLFASHPEMQARIEELGKDAGALTPVRTATAADRYKTHISYEATPLAQVPVAEAGSAGLAGGSNGKEGGSEPKAEDKKKKRRGFGLGSLTRRVSPEKQTAEVSGSGGARGVGPDRLAKGGPNPNPVVVTVTPADLDAFKKALA